MRDILIFLGRAMCGGLAAFLALYLLAEMRSKDNETNEKENDSDV